MSIYFLSFLMLLIASVLGFMLAYAWKDKSKSQLLNEGNKSKRAYAKLRAEYDELNKKTNLLQSEKKKYKIQIENNKSKLKHQKNIARQLENDKEFIFDEYEKFRQAAKEKLEASQKMIQAFDNLKEKTQKEKIKTDKWKIKYHKAVQTLQNVEAEARKLKKEKEALLEQTKNNESTSTSLFEWESNYKELKLRYLALAREKKDLESKLEEFEENHFDDKKILNLKTEIEQLKNENKKLAQKLNSDAQTIKKRRTETVYDRIKSRSANVDFKRIGKAFVHQKDDLKVLSGLGTSIEKRFNSIGIYKFEQIASFNPNDEVLFNHFLELPMGKIQKEGWVAQSRKLIHPEEDPKVILSRIGSKKDHIDFNRIGEASPTKKDNLQLIKGIGPFIEKKLNALGIFRIQQIAYFNDEDIEEINDIIELGSGHIKTDDWVGQAKRMK